MLIHPSIPVTVAADILVWLTIHLALAWYFTRLPASRFDPAAWWFRAHAWESGGRFYEKVFLVRVWKDRLPDGAALFRGGFRKRSLNGRNSAYFDRFRVETCRGELTHWVVMACAPVFFVWNPPAACAVMIAYAALANLPCILAQRYNRIRFARLQQRGRRFTTVHLERAPRNG